MHQLYAGPFILNAPCLVELSGAEKNSAKPC